MLRSRTVHFILLILAVAIVYANSTGGEFIYDDKAMIRVYDLVHDISNIPKAFVSATSMYGNVNYYRPLQTVSNIIDYFLWGDVSFGFHFTNILLHLSAVLLSYVFVQLLFKNRLISFLSALMFAVHPANCSVVSYIAGRADSILLTAMLACYIFYVKYRYYNGGHIAYILSIMFFIVSLLSKETAMMIPLAILLFDKYAVRFTSIEAKKTRGKEYMAFVAVLIVYLLFRFARMSFFVEGSIPPYPLFGRLISVPYFVLEYLRITVFPNDLHMGRELWFASSIADPRIIISAILCGSIFFGAYKVRKKEGGIWFGLCWFILMIFPSLNIITPLYYTLAENWLYVPSLGIFIVFAAMFNKAYSYFGSKGNRTGQGLIVVVIGIYVLSMGAITVGYNKAWKNEMTLAENTLKFNPKEFKVHNNVGVSYLAKGDLDKAEYHFRTCLEIKPDTGMAYFNLYRVYMARGDKAKAVAFLNKARELDPERVGILIEKMGIRD